MKLSSSLFAVVLAGLMASVGTGCKKAAPPPPPARDGVVIDTAKLEATFPAATASPEAVKLLREFRLGVRYAKYLDAMEALDKLSSDPGTTEPQKKVLTELMEQVKQANNNKAAATPEPAAQ